ncbi:HAD-IB family phosphatase [Oscillatoria sp. FACHB-1406]|uniref:HAD-IB family phosphatase n=1 Tax=Oscillatoria sp. FACHB-1406 TaxID=2692846 RepID=UPI001683E0A7|nr:HAD-IB family phosphatase [Oscillatoria sp. FACHB-1406]MBD2576716.1 HAD-IB family phosphatase [Oscillatoria sp. FACHB-1406]
MSFQPVVFCDFDGTITAVETFAGMLKALAPEVAARVMPELYARRMTLRDGVREMLEALPSDRYAEVIGYADNKPVREGFLEFVAFLQEREIPFVIVSGGVRAMVERVVNRLEVKGQPLRNLVTEIVGVRVETDGEFLRVPPQAFEGETELVAKVRVMEKYSGREWVAIGDSVTDINMAIAANRVFARDRLLDYLETEGKSCIPWNNFFDIRDRFSQ